MFESYIEFRQRISRDAHHISNEEIIKEAAGFGPSKGLFENDDQYRDRIARDAKERANERIIEHSQDEIAGSDHERPWFGSDRRTHRLEAAKGKTKSHSQTPDYEPPTYENPGNSASGVGQHKRGGIGRPCVFIVTLVAIALTWSAYTNELKRIQEGEATIARLLQTAAQQVASRRFAEAENLFFDALTVAKDLYADNRNLVIERRKAAYQKIEIPAGGSSQFKIFIVLDAVG